LSVLVDIQGRPSEVFTVANSEQLSKEEKGRTRENTRRGSRLDEGAKRERGPRAFLFNRDSGRKLPRELSLHVRDPSEGRF
jgi:hypothetical protein